MKDYKRFTTRNEKGEWTIELNEELKRAQRDLLTDDFISLLFDIIAQRLCDLEDKIENGTLIELLCNVGDTVYTIDLNNRGERVISEEKISEIVIYDDGVYYHDNMGVWLFEVFKTKAEAEAKLAELKGEQR